MVTFPDEFIGQLVQGMLNADAAAPSYGLMQVFNRELNNLNDETALTVLAKCDLRATVYYGCSLNFKRNGHGRYHHLISSLLKKLRREYYNRE